MCRVVCVGVNKVEVVTNEEAAAFGNRCGTRELTIATR